MANIGFEDARIDLYRYDELLCEYKEAVVFVCKEAFDRYCAGIKEPIVREEYTNDERLATLYLDAHRHTELESW